MSEDNLIAFGAESSTSFRDALTELVRKGARQIIAQAVEVELNQFLAQYQSLKDEQGRQAVVRNGDLPERTIVTGVGEVAIQVPLLGAQVEGLSASTISRLKAQWIQEHQQWQKRTLAANAMCTSGQMASTSTSVTRTIANASWYSLELQTPEKKNCWDWKPGFESQN